MINTKRDLQPGGTEIPGCRVQQEEKNMGADVMCVCMYLPVESWGHESPGWRVEPLLEEEGLDAKCCRWQGPEVWQEGAPPRVGKRFGLK